MKMNKKMLNLLLSGMLMIGMAGCNSNDIEKLSETHMTEKERISTLQGLEGESLTESYEKLLTVEEIQYLNEMGWNIEEEAEYYQKGINLKIPQNYSGNEEELEECIVKQMNKSEQYDEHIYWEGKSIGDTIEFSWTNNTGNDIDLLEINFKEYDESNKSNTSSTYEERIANGETRNIKIYATMDNTTKIEVYSVDVRHVAQDGTHYKGCLPSKWYKLEE